MQPAWDVTAANRLIASLLSAFAAANCLAGSAGSQSWQVTPPALQQPTYAAVLIDQLDSEAASMLQLLRAADERQQPVLRASVNCRKIAAKLLAAGDRAGPAGSVTILAGARLAKGRGEIDQSLNKAPQLDRAGAESITRLLKRFNDDAEALIADGRAFMNGDLDPVLHTSLAGLAEAIGKLEGKPIVSHWPSPPHPAATATQPSLDDLNSMVDLSPLEPAAKTELVSIVDFLKRGEQFAELQPRVAHYRRLLQQLLDVAVAVHGATWMNEDQRSQLDARITHAISVFKDPGTRDAGQREIDHLVELGTMIRQMDALVAERVEIKPIVKAFFETASTAEANEESRSQQLTSIAGIVDRMVAYRKLPDAHLAREARVIERDLHKSYRAAEEALLKQFESLTASSRPLADPSMASLIIEHKQLLTDLERMARTPVWVAAIKAIDASAADAFDRQLQKLCRGLLDPNRRPDSIAAMNEFERQLGMFAQFPFETKLRDADAAAVGATGGMNEQLLALISKERQKWVQAWADGNVTGDAAKRMTQLHRLASTMADIAEMAHDLEHVEVLNRWSAWMLDADLIRRPMSDVSSRLKLATAAAVQGDENGLNQQLEKLERDAPLVTLVGQLSVMLANSLGELDDGAIGVMGELAVPPGSDAWLMKHRSEVADICRYAMEQEHARANGRAELASSLNEFVAAASRQLLTELREYDEVHSAGDSAPEVPR